MILVMGRIWDAVDYTILKVLTLQLKGFWFQWEENPTLLYTAVLVLSLLSSAMIHSYSREDVTLLGLP